MMFTRLKICGITNLEDAILSVHCGVDMLGFNFVRESPRYIDPCKARIIIDQLPFFISKVGIFVHTSLEEIRRIIGITGITAVQIYEPGETFCCSAVSVPVIQAFRIGDQSQKLNVLPDAAMVLVDKFSHNRYGGTGTPFDWTKIPTTLPRHKLILAGGIGPENVTRALEQVRPAAIDVASGAEISPGKKDIQKIQYLVHLIHEFNLQGNHENGNSFNRQASR